MVHLVTASSVFHAQVISARLGAEGIVTHTKGAASTWPLAAPVEVFVESTHLATASSLLLADQAESDDREVRSPSFPIPTWVIGAVAAVIVVCSFAPRWT